MTNITQHLRQREPYTNWGFWEAATAGLNRVPAGPGSEDIGGTGEISFPVMKELLRQMRCYLYTGTQPASYTLGLIEAMMTGCPVVSIGPSHMQIFPYGHLLFEGHEITRLGHDSPAGARSAIISMFRTGIWPAPSAPSSAPGLSRCSGWRRSAPSGRRFSDERAGGSAPFRAVPLVQLLAERLGWTLYTPIGMGWWDAGYWAFGKSTYNDDRLAQQFLVGVAGPDGLGAPPDGEFPDWEINAVTLDQARVMDWAFVIATVPDNEHGFQRFADEMGARLIVQVGNTGQYVDWRRDPLVISSSEMPLHGRGVVYHQEMDPIEYRPPDRASRGGVVRQLHAVHGFVLDAAPRGTGARPAHRRLRDRRPGRDYQAEHGAGGHDGWRRLGLA